MPESSGTDLRIIGLSKPLADHAEPSVWSSIEEEKKKRLQGIHRAELAGEGQMFAGIETAAGNLIRAKLGRLEIDIPTLERVIYARNPKGDYREGYYDPLVGAVVYANRPVETFDKYSTIAHALSHLATKNQVRQYLSPQDSDAPHRTWVSGAEIVGNKQPLAGALEEGMTTLDQVDFFNTYLQINFPQEYARRRQLAESANIGKQIEKQFSKRLYGDISPLTITPFVVFEAHNRRVRGTKIQPALDVIGLKRYLLAQKMCEVLGKSLVPADKIVSPEEAILLGRDLIDRDRYLRTNNAHVKIVEALGSVVGDSEERSRDIHDKNPDARGLGRIGFGGKRAKMIFAAKANDPKSIDLAMPMFRYIVPPTKPLVDINQPPKPNPYKVWIEATPPTPIEPYQPPIKPVSAPASKGETLRGKTDSLTGEAQADEEPAPAVEHPAKEPEVPALAPAAQVVEEMLAPIVAPAESSPVGQRRENTPVDPQLDYFQSQLGREEEKLGRAETRLADILSSHPERKTESALAEEAAIERYKKNIEALNSQIALRTPAEIEKQKEEIFVIKQIWRKSLTAPTTPDQDRLINLGAQYMSHAKHGGKGRLGDLFYWGELDKDDYERITLSRENHLFFADFATYLLSQPNPNPGYVTQLVYLIWDLEMALGGEDAYEGIFGGQGRFLHPDFNRLVTSIKANLSPEVADRLVPKFPKESIALAKKALASQGFSLRGIQPEGLALRS